MRMLSLALATTLMVFQSTAFAKSHTFEITTDIFQSFFLFAGSSNKPTTVLASSFMLNDYVSLGAQAQDERNGNNSKLRVLLAKATVYPFANGGLFLSGGVGQGQRRVEDTYAPAQTDEGVATEAALGWRWTIGSNGLLDLSVAWTNYGTKSEYTFVSSSSYSSQSLGNDDIRVRLMIGFGI